MDTDSGYADLHMHTTASDGNSTVEERVEQAKERGLGAISITDHDRIPASLDTPVTSRDGVKVVTGVEIRADVFDTKVEILGYYVDPTNDSLNSVLERVRGYREERNREMVERLADATGLHITYESLKESVDGSLGRPHLADLLIEEGFADTVSEAFDEYLDEGGDVYVPMERAPYDEVIEAVHEAGGITSLAHPGRIRSDRVPEMVQELVDEGLEALEAWYPYGEIRSEDYANIGVKEAETLAEEHSLLKTGGSDCHGPGSGKFRIGGVQVSRNNYRNLLNSV
jgi:predicted metal-dependent phosphoesterase TrpH